MNSKPFKLIIKPVLAIALIAWVAACNNGSASSTTPATTAYDWQQTFNSDSNSLFNSLSQDSLGNVYSVYLANGDSSTGFGNLVVMKYNSSINQFQQVFNSGDLVSTPLTQFDSLNRLYASYITPAGDVSYVRLNQNGSLSTQGTLLRNAIKKTSLTQATPLSNESFKKLQAQGYSAIPVTLVSPVTPDWYGINSYSFKINDDKMYVAYNNGTNAEAKVCDLNGQCSVPQTLTNESTEQSYFAELGFAPDHSALVVFNEAPNPRGIMKLYNQASESWNQVCADLPLNGKAVSAPLVYNNAAYVVYSHTENNVTATNVMKCDLSSSTASWVNASGTQNLATGAIWYPQIRLYNNTITAFFRQSPDGGSCDVNQNCAIYASQLNSGTWVALGTAESGQFSNAAKISDGSNADLQNPTVQDNQLFVSFVVDTDLSSGQLWQPKVVKYNSASNSWSSFCGVVNNAKQSRRWNFGAGGFIYGTNHPSFLTYSQIIGSNYVPDLQSQPYTAAIAACVE